MAKQKYYLAMDYGASSGRAIIGHIKGEKIHYEELHRFANEPMTVQTSLYWDLFSLYKNLLQSLEMASAYDLESVSIDTWGVDYALIDQEGDVIFNPYHYRDSATKDVFSQIEKYISLDEIYERTGIECLSFNTIYQLFVHLKKKAYAFEHAKQLLFIPDLLNYLLCGVLATEKTIASTSQLYSLANKDWDYELAERIGLRKELLPKILEPGSVLAEVSLAKDGFKDMESSKVVAGASHDTQAALVAVPTKEEDFLFLSSGTWSLLGTELREPLVNAKSLAYNFTNEQAYGARISFHKNMMGMWLVQECLKEWKKEEPDLDFVTLSDLAKEAVVAGTEEYLFDPDDETLINPKSMTKAIQELCMNKYGKAPQSIGEICQVIYDSLSQKYTEVIAQIEEMTGKSYRNVHVIGGGSQNAILNQCLADRSGKSVLAGPVESTAIGNILVQAIAAKELRDLKEARQVVIASEKITVYQPQSKNEKEKPHDRE